MRLMLDSIKPVVVPWLQYDRFFIATSQVYIQRSYMQYTIHISLSAHCSHCMHFL